MFNFYPYLKLLIVENSGEGGRKGMEDIDPNLQLLL